MRYTILGCSRPSAPAGRQAVMASGRITRKAGLVSDLATAGLVVLLGLIFDSELRPITKLQGLLNLPPR
jgi:hypothetical protein